MKKIALGLLFMLGAWTTNAQKMTADQIIEKYVETVGGAEAWSKLKGQKMVATAAVQGMEFPIEMYELKDGRQITKFDIQGRAMVQGAFDGETLWSISFMTMKAEKDETEATENFKRTIGEFPGALFTYKSMGYTAELDGEDVKEGVECYKIKMTKKPEIIDGKEVPNIQYYFIDKENFVPVTIEEEITSGQGKGQTSTTILSDYQEVNGLYFAFAIKQGDGMNAFEITIDSVELNPTVEDSVFAFPAEEGK